MKAETEGRDAGEKVLRDQRRDDDVRYAATFICSKAQLQKIFRDFRLASAKARS